MAPVRLETSIWMAKTPKTLQVSFGGFSCTLEGFDDPVEAMRAVTEYLRELSTRDPAFAERIGLAAPPPIAPSVALDPAPAITPQPLVPPRPPAPSVTLAPGAAPAFAAAPPLTAAPQPLAPPGLPAGEPTPADPPVPSVLEPAPVIAPPLPEAQRESIPDPAIPPAPDAPDLEMAAPVATKDAEDEAGDDEVAAVEPDAHPGLQRLLSATPEGEEEEFSRILSRADDQLADPEAARRRGVIAQLKAAVAATEAERAMGDGDANPQTRQGAFRHDLSEAVRTQAPVAARPDQAPLRLVASQRVDAPSDLDASLDDEEEDEEDTLPVRRPGSFRVFATELSAISLPDLLEAAAAWLCFVDERESVSRAQLLSLATEALDETPEREEGLRAFGTLLREGRIAAVAGGRYRVSESSRFHPARLAG